MQFLFERLNFERTTDRPYNEQHYRLNRMRRLLELLGSPQLAAPVVHIAGTKGKGSVAWLIAETLRLAGLNPGLYSSPHLVHLEERWHVNGKAAEPLDVVAMTDSLRQATAELNESDLGPPTFFELTTALAWLLFQHHRTGVNVIEVGLGGRLDSTNVCDPILTIITSISLDHQQQLGNTIGRIAGEKAGIIKQGIPVISGATSPEAAAVIEHVALQQDSPLYQLHRDFDVQYHLASNAVSTIDFDWNSSPFPSRHQWPLKMLGKHQAHNAALACAAIDQLNHLGWNIDERALQDSLRLTQVPGRMQCLHANPWIILDTAHNVASIQALVETLENHFQPQRRILVFSASRDKDYPAMLKILFQRFDTIVLTQFQSNARAIPIEQLLALANQILAEQTASRPTLFAELLPCRAMELAKRIATPDDLICASGSFFLAAELLENEAI